MRTIPVTRHGPTCTCKECLQEEALNWAHLDEIYNDKPFPDLED